MLKEMWNDKDRRRGLIGSIIFHAILLLLFLFVGLKYLEPKPEEGIVINFGNSETGIGNEADGAQTAVSEPTPQTFSEPVETPNEVQTPVQTQDVVEAPAMETKKNNKPKTEENPKEVEPEKPKPSSELEKMLQSVKSSKAGGEGEKEGAGNQGDPSGDPNSPNRTGSGGGAGGGGNYLLGGRQALHKPKPDYPCPDEGRVIVKIYVDQNGKVTNAIPGERIPGGVATTTASGCLFDKAKAAALRTTWQPDVDAPSQQIGYIIYNFQKQ